MNKGKNKGKIQKSRQNAEGREAGSFLGKVFDSYHKFLSNKVINFVIKYDFSNWNCTSFYDEDVQ